MPVHTVKGYYRKDGTYVKTFSRVFSSIYRGEIKNLIRLIFAIWQEIQGFL